jgi:glycine hydroxymethyltransferase
LLSNYDAARLYRFAESLNRSRPSLVAYARATVANTAAFRDALIELDIPVLVPADGVLGTHQILMIAREHDHAQRIVADLQRSRITTSVCRIPGRPSSWAVRLGTQLITRRGMGTDQMRHVAQIMAAVMRAEGRFDFSHEVEQLTAAFPAIRYCGEHAVHGCGQRLLQ